MPPDKLLQNTSFMEGQQHCSTNPSQRDRSTRRPYISQPAPSDCTSLHGSASPALQEGAGPGGEYLMHHLWEIPRDI